MKTCHKQKGCDCWDTEKEKCSHFRETDTPKNTKLQQEIAQVKKLGKEIGYGHLMSLASALWRKNLKNEYGFTVGAFIPTCIDDEQMDKETKATVDQYDKFISTNDL